MSIYITTEKITIKELKKRVKKGIYNKSVLSILKRSINPERSYGKMKLNKLIRLSKEHAETMYQICLDKFNQEREAQAKKGAKK